MYKLVECFKAFKAFKYNTFHDDNVGGSDINSNKIVCKQRKVLRFPETVALGFTFILLYTVYFTSYSFFRIYIKRIETLDSTTSCIF